MCGLFGMAGPGLINFDLKILKDLGTVSMLRGTDGAGVYQIRSRSQKHYNLEEGFRTWGNWQDLVDEVERKKSNKILNSVGVDVVLCHVRAATRGVVSEANSHPFAFPNLVGAHNGTLKDKKYNEHPTKTDSELMFRDINERGMETVLTELDKDSAFAVSVFDRQHQVLRFARNELRTLAFAFLEARGVMYWASEKDMLKYVLGRAGEEATYFNLRPNKLVSIDPNQITKRNIEAGPLGIIKADAILERPLPTTIQKIKDAKDAREAKEAAEAAKALQTSSTPDTGGNITTNTGIETSTDTKITTQQMSNVVPFVPNKGDKETKKAGLQVQFSTESLYRKCSCGSKTLNLLDQSLAKRGKHKRLTFNPEANTFSCEGCATNVQTG